MTLYVAIRPAPLYLGTFICRANCLALVNREWQRLERETRHHLQPTALIVYPWSCNSSYLTWHVGQKLTHLILDASEVSAPDFCSLQLAFSRASALQSLRFRPPSLNFKESHAQHRLSILGCHTKLTELRLCHWGYSAEDLQHVAALSALSNLKVCSMGHRLFAAIEVLV